MTTRESAPLGAPCWTDLWTSDVDAAAKFYGELFGWEAQEGSPEFGGYFMFHRDGIPIAGGMPGMPAENVWKIYLQTDDITKALETAESEGATNMTPAIPVADLGIQAVFTDPTGAVLGAWQAGTFPGFTVLGEPGAPSWFELMTRDHAKAVAFYRSVFHWETQVVGDSDEFRYDVMRNPQGEDQLAGIMDASGFLPEGAPAYWSVYWDVEDVDGALVKVKALGGSVVSEAQDSPYGRMATVTDTTGSQFKLRTAPIA